MSQFSLRLREPVDILSAIPYLIGYHPLDCVVVIGIGDGQLRVTTRADLPADGDDARVHAEGLYEALRGMQIDGGIVVAYGADERVRPVVAEIASTFGRLRLTLYDAIRADAGRYWSYACADAACCPPEGTPFDVRGSRVAAEATLAGLSAMPDREAFESQVRPVTGAARAAMTRATHRARRRLARLLSAANDEPDLVGRLVRDGSAAVDAGLRAQRAGRPVDDDLAAWLSVLLDWDEVWQLALTRVGHSRTALLHSRALWLEVLRRAEPDLICGPATLFAYASWLAGDLVLARLALERALDSDPTDPLAQMLHAWVIAGRPPARQSTQDSSAVRFTRPRGRRPRRRSSSRRAGSPPT